jgi:hypothetical protein
VSKGGTGKIISGKLGGRVGELCSTPLDGMTIVVVATSGSVCVAEAVLVGMLVICKLVAVMNEN